MTRFESRVLALAAALVLQPAQAGTMPSFEGDIGAFAISPDPASGDTRVSGRVASDQCFVLLLPKEWAFDLSNGEGTTFRRKSDGIALGLSIRSAKDLRDLPQTDLASRDAAFLQRDYEELLGPAQTMTVASLPSGAMRWSATWIDGNLPAASRALTVEAFIAPLSSAWLLELSLKNVERRETRVLLMSEILSALRTPLSCLE